MNRTDLDLRLSDVNVSRSHLDLRGLSGDFNLGDSGHELVIHGNLSNSLEFTFGLELREFKGFLGDLSKLKVMSSSASTISGSGVASPLATSSGPVSSTLIISASGVLSPGTIFSSDPSASALVAISVGQLSPLTTISAGIFSLDSRNGVDGSHTPLLLDFDRQGGGEEQEGEQRDSLRRMPGKHDL